MGTYLVQVTYITQASSKEEALEKFDINSPLTHEGWDVDQVTEDDVYEVTEEGEVI